jgi:hypothetical protein
LEEVIEVNEVIRQLDLCPNKKRRRHQGTTHLEERSDEDTRRR